MKRPIILLAIALSFIASLIIQEPTAYGFEVAVGYWQQSPSGEIGYKADGSDDILDIEDDLDYGSEDRFFGRLKVELPLFLPNIYLMATPMEFDGEGSVDVDFEFGDETFKGNTPFDSRVRMDHYDITLYYNLPFIKKATLEKLNIELGINARILDFEADIDQDLTGISESYSITLAVPMIYAGIQIRPVKYFSIEGEGRVIAYSGNHYYDFIARAKITPFGPFFIAGGYRSENFKFNESDFEAEIVVDGPFAEVGIEF
ncbi:MAG: TIGR04219 family outer membrane beta-barrel protein [Thermodesulfovibrionales bacterium]